MSRSTAAYGPDGCPWVAVRQSPHNTCSSVSAREALPCVVTRRDTLLLPLTNLHYCLPVDMVACAKMDLYGSTMFSGRFAAEINKALQNPALHCTAHLVTIDRCIYPPWPATYLNCIVTSTFHANERKVTAFVLD